MAGKGKGHECYHCKQWVAAGEEHDCWTTTEAALTADLTDDLRDAWERLRETAAEFGAQRIYASHKSIMFARKRCYFFVRPKKSYLEICVFLDRAVRHPRIRKVEASSKTKFYHLIPVKHRDEVEAPITEWLREAYELEDKPRPVANTTAARKPRRTSKAATQRSGRRVSRSREAASASPRRARRSR
jgi:hypothetical protein